MAGCKWTTINLIPSLMVIFLCLSICTALNCYECGGEMGTPEGEDCAALRNIGNSTGYKFCTTVSNERLVRRSGINIDRPYADYCESSICYCNNTNLCNYRTFERNSVTCYVCETVSLLDNGCGNGDYWKPGMTWVRKEAGCSACSKVQDKVSIKRDCLYSIHSVDRNTCTRSLDTISCTCSGNDCNHASRLPLSSFFAYIAAGLVTIWKIW